MKVEYHICDNCGQQISNDLWKDKEGLEFCSKRCMEESKSEE